MYNTFRLEFVAKNPKKSLTLNRNYGCAKVLAYFDSRRTTYQFVLSFGQTVVILLFNRKQQLSFGELQAKTKMDTDSLLQTIELFLRYACPVLSYPVFETN